MAVATFRAFELVPDLVPVAPEEELQVEFGNDKVNLGNILTPTQVQNRPTLVKWNADNNALYTLIFTDPDAPSRAKPDKREFHHWIVVNIPGGDISKGETLSHYIGSGPPPDSGLHRYVYLIYKQPGKIADPDHGVLPDNDQIEKRGGFSTAKFAAKHGLGDPVAGNFYQAQFDDYVPILYKKFGKK